MSFVINFLDTYIFHIIRHKIFKKAPNCILCTEPVRRITLHFQDCLHENRQTRRKNRQKSVKTKRGCVNSRSKLSVFSKQKSADFNKDSSGPFLEGCGLLQDLRRRNLLSKRSRDIVTEQNIRSMKSLNHGIRLKMRKSV